MSSKYEQYNTTVGLLRPKGFFNVSTCDIDQQFASQRNCIGILWKEHLVSMPSLEVICLVHGELEKKQPPKDAKIAKFGHENSPKYKFFL